MLKFETKQASSDLYVNVIRNGSVNTICGRVWWDVSNAKNGWRLAFRLPGLKAKSHKCFQDRADAVKHVAAVVARWFRECLDVEELTYKVGGEEYVSKKEKV